jgi:hypothetical protein
VVGDERRDLRELREGLLLPVLARVNSLLDIALVLEGLRPDRREDASTRDESEAMLHVGTCLRTCQLAIPNVAQAPARIAMRVRSE